MKKNHALVELLVVIAIIALLLSILMPSLQKAREHKEKCLCNEVLRRAAGSGRLFAIRTIF